MTRYSSVFIVFIIFLNIGYAQNVGIDVADPLGKLHLKANSSVNLPQLRLTEEGLDFTRIKMENDANLGSYWDIAGRASNNPSTGLLNIYYNSPTLSGDWLSINGTGKIGVNNTNPQARLDIRYIGEDEKILKFTTDRPWWFKQTGTGVGTKLTLQAQHNYKNFEVVSPNGLNRAAVFRVADAESNVYLSPENGSVGVGNTNPQAKLDVSGKIKIGNDESIPDAGTVRWNADTNDFEGYNGNKWLSLTTDKESTSWPVYNGEGTSQLLNFSEDSLLYEGDNITMNNTYAAIGSPDEKKVMVYSFENEAWTYLQTLTPSDFPTAENFGCSIAIYGNWMVIGAASGSGMGKVYVFTLNGNTWIEHQILTDATGENSDLFGHSVAIWGTDLIVGSPEAVINSIDNAGKMSFFKLSNGNWVDNGEYANSTPTLDAHFAFALGINGNHIAVGIPFLFSDEDGSIEIFKHFSANIWNRPGLFLDDYAGPGWGVVIDMNSTKLITRKSTTHIHFELVNDIWEYNGSSSGNANNISLNNNYFLRSSTSGESQGPMNAYGHFDITSLQYPFNIIKFQYNHSPSNTNFGISSDINDNDWIGVICHERVFFSKIFTN